MDTSQVAILVGKGWGEREARQYLGGYTVGTSAEDALAGRGTPAYLHPEMTSLALEVHGEIPRMGTNQPTD